MSRMDLLEVNAGIVRSVAENIAKHSPERGHHHRVEPAGRDDRARPAGVAVPEEPGVRPGRRARHRAVHQQRRDDARRAGRLGADADARLARRHDGAGAVRVLRRRQAAGRRHGRRARSRSSSPAPATAAPRSWPCSRPARRTTRRRPPPPAWPGPSSRTPAQIIPVCAWVDGEYGISGVYLGVEAEIGRGGVTQGRRARPDRFRAGRAEGGRRGRPRQAGRHRQSVVPARHPARHSCRTVAGHERR